MGFGMLLGRFVSEYGGLDGSEDVLRIGLKCRIAIESRLSGSSIRACRYPGSTSPPGSPHNSTPHSLATVASVLSPTYAFRTASKTAVGKRG